MRHSVFGRRLGRDTNARRALLGNLASVLLINGQLKTTTAKAKFAQAFVEKLITKAKKKSYVAHRRISQEISKPAFKRLITEIGPGFTARSGGYTRIIRLTSRAGDAAEMARLELLPVDKKTVTESTEKNKEVTETVTNKHSVPSVIEKQSVNHHGKSKKNEKP